MRLLMVPVIVLVMLAAQTAAGKEAGGADVLVAYVVEKSTVRLADGVRATLTQVDGLLRSVERLLAPGAPAGEVMVHQGLRRLSEGPQALRSMILVDPSTGRILYDSFSLPAPSFNLGDRDYVRNAPAGDGPPYVGLKAVGRSSGLPFVPVARRVRSAALGEDGDVVAVGIVPPHALMPPGLVCGTCAAAILRPDGTVIAAEPPGFIFPDDLRPLMAAQPEGGTAVVLAQRLRAFAGWRRIGDLGLTVMFYTLIDS